MGIPNGVPKEGLSGKEAEVFSGATFGLAFSGDNGYHGEVGNVGNDKAEGVFFPVLERAEPYCPVGGGGESG